MISNAPSKGVVKTQTLISSKDEVKQQKLSAAALVEQLGMEFPQQGLPVVMDDGEPVAVHAEDLVSPNSFFLTDYSGHNVIKLSQHSFIIFMKPQFLGRSSNFSLKLPSWPLRTHSVPENYTQLIKNFWWRNIGFQQ